MENQEVKVMLIEDSPEDVAFTKRILRHSRLERDLVVASDGREALESLENLKRDGLKLPDLILLDINLPRISGIDVLTRLKANPGFSQIPVVMLTGSSIGGDIQRSYDLGASTYLVKPISKDALVVVIKKLFG